MMIYIYKRAEYYHSSIDIETVDKGLNFNKVPHKYLIYILTNNFLEFKDPIIHEEMRIIEHLEMPTRGYRTNIYINTTVETKEPNLKSFFDFVQKEEVNHPMTNLLSETIMKVQGNNESRRTFMDIVNTRRIEREEARADGLKEGKIEGANNRTKEICINMINRGMNVNDIAELTGLSLDAIQDIKKSV